MKKKNVIKQPEQKIPQMPKQRRPVKRAGGESPLTIRTPTCIKDISNSPAMKPKGQSQAVLFHRKGCRNS